MKSPFRLMSFLGALLASGGLSHALTIPASEDTTFVQRKATAASNSAGLLTVDATGKGFVYFNLDDIPKGTAIRLARLRVYLSNVTARGNGLSVHLVTSPWDEAVAGAEPRYDATPIAKMDTDKLGTSRFVTVDVTAVVQNWISQKAPNEGFALVAAPAGDPKKPVASVTIAAKEGSDSGLPAHLEIELADETKVGQAGPIGPQGPQGLKGEPGVSGKAVLSGTVAPTSTTGAVGDLYLNTANGALYGPKTATSWGTPRSLVGPKGDAGPQGPTGPAGAKGDAGPAGAKGASGQTILSGTVAPTTVGGIGDFYINTAKTALYGPKTSNGWGTPTSLVGPQGPKGDTGDTGAAGAQGEGFTPGGSVSAAQFSNDLATLLGYFKPSVSVIYDSTGNVLRPIAKGSGTLSYQWLMDNSEVANATTLQLTGLNLASGSYALRVSNGIFTTVSEPVYCSSDMLGMVNVFGGSLTQVSGLVGQVVSDFQIGNAEVTWADWQAVRDWAVENGYSDLADVGAGAGDNYPVTNVSWYDVVKWCNARSEKEGKTPAYELNGATYKTGQGTPTVNTMASGYRLPTEAEWAWAASGGRQTLGYTYSGSNDASVAGWTSDNSVAAIHQRGEKAANELGIYDMSGNAFEWCWDLSDDQGNRRIRGGSWYQDATNATVANRGTASPLTQLEDVGFRVVLSSGIVSVPGGTLPQGSLLAEQVVSDFQIGKTEVTLNDWNVVRDWALVNGYTDLADVGSGTGDNYPVVNVSWYDVVKWCNAKSEKEGKTPVYQVDGETYKTGESAPTTDITANGYRLPTEAEWEWAARGGLQTHGYTYSGSNDLNAVGWYADNSVDGGSEVGKKAANELGIYDMSGSVWEWCADWHPDYVDSDRVIRGGDWLGDVLGPKVDRRDFNSPGTRYEGFGFRVALSLVP